MPSLSPDDLDRLWRAVVDPEYARGLDTAGGGEVVRQLAEQLGAVAAAAGRSASQLFILPHSSQEHAPASGARRSTVTLRVTRTDCTGVVVLPPGRVVEESVFDYGQDGAQRVTSGRRYVTQAAAVLPPGVAASEVLAEAERSGDGYNLPALGTLSAWSRELTGSGVGAEITAGNLFQVGTGDALGGSHLGSYVEILNGAAAGQIRQVVAVFGDGVVALDTYWILAGVSAGAWIPGESVEGPGGSAVGVVLAATAETLAIDSSAALVAGAYSGRSSGATFAAVGVVRDGLLAAETLVAWRLRTYQDLGIGVTNDAQPSGGRQAWLDEHGWERGIDRSAGESDDSYRARVAAVPDVVSPNAILRAANRVLAPFGLWATLREPGTPSYPGLFFDVQDASQPTAFDLPDAIAFGEHRLLVSLATSRAFFYLEVPEVATTLGPAIAFDDDAMINAFDVGMATDLPVSYASTIYGQVFDAVRPVVGGGVGWELTVRE